MSDIKSIDDIIAAVNVKSSGRTRYEGQDPFQYWDECLVARIAELEKELQAANDWHQHQADRIADRERGDDAHSIISGDRSRRVAELEKSNRAYIAQNESRLAQIAELEAVVSKLPDEIRKRWSFNDSQQHTHTWHDREDFIKWLNEAAQEVDDAR